MYSPRSIPRLEYFMSIIPSNAPVQRRKCTRWHTILPSLPSQDIRANSCSRKDTRLRHIYVSGFCVQQKHQTTYTATSADSAATEPFAPFCEGLCIPASSGAACSAGFSTPFIFPLLRFSRAAFTQSATSWSSTTSIAWAGPLSPAA